MKTVTQNMARVFETTRSSFQLDDSKEKNMQNAEENFWTFRDA